ncbi:Response regulator of zinc sigma-54-dependent two-component system [Thermogutta terrifontis]|jgi:DNA-binding NtrC family response regulator|uniref:Response regulator of zinc sigma-54-dependent two-component system n=1 Tax=Thermogutta terrifontis TaxID=1331910 RepID=A0A286RKN3_9BACT|nr:sigma-54 dependent transcriptional regulator [Thermogutta terrifontis]ASV76516.1 Response regulator of zinc sigma-54-dependent two-component system [Thermogutta terrifontis]
MPKAALLLVDDDRHLLQAMANWLREQDYRVDTATGVQEALRELARRSYDVAVVDIRLGDGDGFDVLRFCRERYPEMPVILVTGYGSVDLAVEAIRAGAFDFLTKPLIDEELQVAIERALNQKRVVEENKNLKTQLDMRYGLDAIVGRDHRMLRVYDVIEAVADTKATVLITGESGTGKSLIARAIHRRSSRRDKPFVEVACGALPETLLESELFGHVAGAFTGATGDKIGKFKQADGGTIFLDEIGTASPALQVKLLRVLQDYQFEPVGGTETITVDVRVILATNEDLQKAVQEGRFRRDLYYRINVINIELPPLRERVSDIPLLAEHFLKRICEEMGRPLKTLSDEALAALQAYRWPGNVRELQNVLERAVLLGRKPVITLEDLPPDVAAALTPGLGPPEKAPLKQALQLPERQIILQMLEMHNWNRQATAKALGINRTTLYKKMKRLGIEEPESTREKSEEHGSTVCR